MILYFLFVIINTTAFKQNVFILVNQILSFVSKYGLLIRKLYRKLSIKSNTYKNRLLPKVIKNKW